MSKLMKTVKEEYVPKKLDKLSTGRIVGMCFMGLIISGLLCLMVMSLVVKWVKYPPKEKVKEEDTGIYCLREYEKEISTLTATDTDAYIQKEVDFANGNEEQLSFCKKITSTVKYIPKQGNAKNIYGNDYKDNKGNVVVEESTVHENEVVTLEYVDYNAINVDEKVVKSLLSDAELSLNVADYQHRLISVFCRYINNYGDLPLKQADHKVNIVKLGKDSFYSVNNAEDEYLDSLLFSSNELYSLFDRFSEVAARSQGKSIKETDEWKSWNKSSKEGIQPLKYDYKECLARDWCGAYYLENFYVVKDPEGNETVGISANIGDGTLENPAGLNTEVVTSVFDGKGKESPIKVELIEYGVSEDAINWFEAKDERNRGIDVQSEIQYCYFVFRVTNLSNKELVIADNSTLCDSNANVSSRTGTIYGLKDSAVLKPDETGIIESWNKSTELNKKYVIWGNDFARRTNPVWFRVLAGNIDDPSEDKGVTLNKTRDSLEE